MQYMGPADPGEGYAVTAFPVPAVLFSAFAAEYYPGEKQRSACVVCSIGVAGYREQMQSPRTKITSKSA